MGGDGGTVVSSRRFMRGAGSAGHTADVKRHSDAEDEKERQKEMMRTCAISGARLNFQQLSSSSSSIVACPYGRLYDKEAAIQALLRRKTEMMEEKKKKKSPMTTTMTTTEEIGWHVRGLKDLYPVHFHVAPSSSSSSKTTETASTSSYVPLCPITGVELNGLSPAFLLIASKKKQQQKQKDDKAKTTTATTAEIRPNVLSDRAMKEMTLDLLQEEYGPYDNIIRLAPPMSAMKEIQNKLEQTRLKESEEQASAKKKSKKRKDATKDTSQSTSKKKQRLSSNAGVNTSTAEMARTNVASAVASNTVLSSLFSHNDKVVSEKDKKDNLFAR